MNKKALMYIISGTIIAVGMLVIKLATGTINDLVYHIMGV